MTSADWITGLLSLGALLVSWAAWRNSRNQDVSRARAEVLGYAGRMATLDRKGGRANGNQLGLLGAQAGSIIDEYTQKRLRLSGALYQVMAEYLVLNTDESDLVTQFLTAAELQAKLRKNKLELIRTFRTRGELAARNVDIGQVKKYFGAAVREAEVPASDPKAAVLTESLRRTYAYALFAALLALERGGGDEAEEYARESYAKAEAHDLEKLERQKILTIARRSQLVHELPTGLDDDLLNRWHAIWRKRDRGSLD